MIQTTENSPCSSVNSVNLWASCTGLLSITEYIQAHTNRLNFRFNEICYVHNFQSLILLQDGSQMKKKRSKIQKFLNGHLSTATFQFWLKQYPTFLLGRLELFPDALNFISFIAFNFILQDLIVLYLISFISLSIWHKVTVNFSVRSMNIISPWLCIGAIP